MPVDEQIISAKAFTELTAKEELKLPKLVIFIRVFWFCSLDRAPCSLRFSFLILRKAWTL